MSWKKGCISCRAPTANFQLSTLNINAENAAITIGCNLKGVAKAGVYKKRKKGVCLFGSGTNRYDWQTGWQIEEGYWRWRWRWWWRWWWWRLTDWQVAKKKKNGGYEFVFCWRNHSKLMSMHIVCMCEKVKEASVRFCCCTWTPSTKGRGWLGEGKDFEQVATCLVKQQLVADFVLFRWQELQISWHKT